MTEAELREIIANLRVFGGDISEVEAKRSQTALPKSLRETVSAFSNTTGGVIVLGLDESTGFSVVGVDQPAKLSADLAALCAEQMEPPVRPLIDIHRVDGVSVLVAEIPAMDRAQKPVYYKGAGISQGSYVRVGDGDRKLSSYEVQILLSSRGQPREDERLTSAPVSALDQDLVDQFVARLQANRPYVFQRLDKEGVLRRAKVIATDEMGQDRTTLAGLLSLGNYPQEDYPQLMLTFVHHPTAGGVADDSGIRFVDNATAEGPIPVMVRDALIVIRRNMSRRAVISGVGRTDVWEYPETALREVVVNALVHRDFSESAAGTQVQVDMYPDRLVVTNPGGLFGPVTVDNLGEEGISSARNATLLRILEEVPIPGSDRTVCENRGSGIRAMVAALRAAGMSPPVFSDRISSFKVEFPNHTLLSDETVDWIRLLNEQGLTNSQCIGLAMLRGGQALDNKSYRTATGLDSRVATQELGDLVGRDLVTQASSRRWARYFLSSRAREGGQADDGPVRLRADRRQEIVDALGGGALSRAEIVQRTGLRDGTVRRWLRILRDEGRVEFTIAEPRSHNVKYRLRP